MLQLFDLVGEYVLEQLDEHQLLLHLFLVTLSDVLVLLHEIMGAEPLALQLPHHFLQSGELHINALLLVDAQGITHILAQLLLLALEQLEDILPAVPQHAQDLLALLDLSGDPGKLLEAGIISQEVPPYPFILST